MPSMPFIVFFFLSSNQISNFQSKKSKTGLQIKKNVKYYNVSWGFFSLLSFLLFNVNRRDDLILCENKFSDRMKKKNVRRDLDF